MLFQIGSLFLLNLLYRWMCARPWFCCCSFDYSFASAACFFSSRFCSINSQVMHWQTNVKSYCWNCYVQVYQRRRWCNLMSRHFNFFFIGFDDKRVDCWEFIEFFICSMSLCLPLATLFYKTFEKMDLKWTTFCLFKETIGNVHMYARSAKWNCSLKKSVLSRLYTYISWLCSKREC